jgi:hypothetical protein
VPQTAAASTRARNNCIFYTTTALALQMRPEMGARPKLRESHQDYCQLTNSTNQIMVQNEAVNLTQAYVQRDKLKGRRLEGCLTGIQ